jgi:hypothetical protein
VLAGSFRGGVDLRRAGRGEVRAHVAVHGSNVEALTSEETFRIPLARCLLDRDGKKLIVRDEQGSLVIWSDDEAFLDVLERAQRGTLKGQVERLRAAELRRRALRLLGGALVAAAVLFVASIPFTRWAVQGGVPAIANRIGEAAFKHLDLPSGVAPTVERRLAVMADQLRPACPLSTRSFRVLLADYAGEHTFSMPPDMVIVTSGLVCGAEDPKVVTEAVARELAHLENRDVSDRVAETVDWHTPVDLVLGDVSKLRDRMLDFADPKRSPGFTEAQEAAASERAVAILKYVGVPTASEQELAALTASLKQVHMVGGEKDQGGQAQPAAGGDDPLDWSKVRAEACDVIGH